MKILEYHPVWGTSYAVLTQGQCNWKARPDRTTTKAVLYEFENGARLWIPRKALRIHIAGGFFVRDWFNLEKKLKDESDKSKSKI